MTEAPVTVVTQHTSNGTGLVVMINYKRPFKPTNNTLLGSVFEMPEVFVADYIAELTPIDTTTVRGSARTAPTIKSGLGPVMWWKMLYIERLPLLTAGTGLS